ncbi:low molecular weight protein-tyrosine-phosphatase [Endothiovibrio diazotrophicus]
MNDTPTVNVLFVCLGNICRSPTAEGVFTKLVRDEGLAERIDIDSAGTAGWHVGKAPDTRAQQAARNRGVELSHLRGRQVSVADFDHFDYILAMDSDNYANLVAIAPRGQRYKVRKFLEFASQRSEEDVPDPYYGGASGFDHVLDLVEDAARGLLEEIRTTRL